MKKIGAVLIAYAGRYEITVTPEQAERFQSYMELLLEWNTKINLTAITEPDEIAAKHFLDCILLLKFCDVPSGAKFIDVGTGAGFPGVVMKIMRPDLRLTLLDSLNKRLLVLSDILGRLGLDAELLHGRAEEVGRKPQYRLQYEFAAARAVASLPVLCEYCLPFLKKGGVFAAMKGPDPRDEAAKAGKAVSALGCAFLKTEEYTLPNGEGRSVILIRRTAGLPVLYPRHGSKIAKSPIL